MHNACYSIYTKMKPRTPKEVFWSLLYIGASTVYLVTWCFLEQCPLLELSLCFANFERKDLAIVLALYSTSCTSEAEKNAKMKLTSFFPTETKASSATR